MDTVSHHFYECAERRNFAPCEIIIGLPLSGNHLLKVLNFVVSLLKQFINKNKRRCTKEWLFIEFRYIKGKLKSSG